MVDSMELWLHSSETPALLALRRVRTEEFEDESAANTLSIGKDEDAEIRQLSRS